MAREELRRCLETAGRRRGLDIHDEVRPDAPWRRIEYKVVQENAKTSEVVESEEYDDKLTCAIDENVMQIEQGISMVSDIEKASRNVTSSDIWIMRKQIAESPE